MSASITETLRAPDFWTAHIHGNGSLSEEQEAAPFQSADLIDDLVGALEACRDRFAEYVELHRAKLHDGTPTSAWLAANAKVERNQAMVLMCDAALAKAKP